MLRFLLAWMLVLALPLQGLAAGVLGACHGTVDQAAVAVVSAAVVQGDAADVQHPCHAQPSQPDAASCSACAACCTAAMAPQAMARWPVVVPQTEPAVWSMPAPAAGWTLPLERPPRDGQA